jgi:cytochrome c6
MSAHRRPLALVATLALALAGGCGGGDDSSAGDEIAGGTATESRRATGPQETFASSCGGCHTLQAAGTNGQVGPDLDEAAPSADEVRRAIDEGPGVMPSALLQGADADAVAAYVAENAGG